MWYGTVEFSLRCIRALLRLVCGNTNFHFSFSLLDDMKNKPIFLHNSGKNGTVMYTFLAQNSYLTSFLLYAGLTLFI